jgi:hypothetical protein
MLSCGFRRETSLLPLSWQHWLRGFFYGCKCTDVCSAVPFVRRAADNSDTMIVLDAGRAA